jgi:hypothetical protein
VTHGPDEEGAYYAQLMELHCLGLSPGRWQYRSVKRSMETVLKSRRRRSDDTPFGAVVFGNDTSSPTSISVRAAP